MLTRPRAVCDVSGGFDSAMALYELLHEGWEVRGLFVGYGQEYQAEERDAACYVAEWASERYDGQWLGLTERSITLELSMPSQEGTPIECVPQRNLIICALGANLAQHIGAGTVVNGSKTGVRRPDDPYSFADSCEEFYADLSNLVAHAYESGTCIPQFQQRLRRPSSVSTSAEPPTKQRILAALHAGGLDLRRLWNCYHPVGQPGRPCGSCYHCSLTRKALDDAELLDVDAYAEWWSK